MRRAGLCLTAVATACSVPVTPSLTPPPSGCSSSPAELDALAQRYAPVYFLAPDERYLPTLPYFSAFDREDNDEDGSARTDYLDLDEIAPLHHSEPVPSWNSLDAWYAALRDSLPPPVIFFHIGDIPPGSAESDALWRYLRSDEQAWKRTRSNTLTLDSVRSRMRARQGFTVLEYYAYYINDVGLEGHALDIEPVFVFVPQQCPPADTLAVRASDFRMIVGAGHTQQVPNNVLLLFGQRAQDSLARPRIIVELGDHSSATDYEPYREFRPGWDANWHIQHLWGVRDTQSSHGMRFLGQYQLDMTFPRDEVAGAIDLYPPQVDRAGIAKGRGRKVAQYSLVRVNTLQSVYTALAGLPAGGGPAPPLSVGRIKALTSGFKRLAEELAVPDDSWSVGDFVALLDSSDASAQIAARAAVARMRWWTASMRADGTKGPLPGVNRIWLSPHFTEDEPRILKQHLFRPTTGTTTLGSFLTSVRPTFTFMTAEDYRVGLGWVVPAIESFPVRLPGILEVHIGAYGRAFDALADVKDHRPTVSLAYEQSYGRQITWYTQLSKIWDRDHVDPDETQSYTIEGGMSFGLNSQPKTRLRFGPRVGIAGQVTVDWTVQISWLR